MGVSTSFALVSKLVHENLQNTNSYKTRACVEIPGSLPYDGFIIK